MPDFIFLLTMFAALKIARDLLFYLWLWQIKEYRIDRMISYFKDSRDLSAEGIFYFAAFILAAFLSLSNESSKAIYVLIFLFFALADLRILMELKERSLKKPKATLKIFVILSLTILCYLIMLLIAPSSIHPEYAGIILLLYIATPTIVAISILLINPFFNFQKNRIISKASAKMLCMKKVRTIGITGSYGKTSTKEFLYAILSKKYKVVKTEGNNNTNIGVAYTVLDKVNDDYDFFICEMGAYKIGEIAEIAGIVKPEIGILTGINEQHADLFGSINNTIKAKFELIRSLPENGYAVVNSRIRNNTPSKVKVKNIRYFSANEATNVRTFRNHIEFDFHDAKFKANILGKHYVENLLSSILVSEYLGMHIDDIAKAVSEIKSSDYMMRMIPGANDSVFIDDSYSANPDGVFAALDYLKETFNGFKKIMVFPGIIELGKETDKIHSAIFKKISNICDNAYILKRDMLKYVPNDASHCNFYFDENFRKIAEMIQKDANSETVVLFESRGAGVVMGKVQNAKIKNHN